MKYLFLHQNMPGQFRHLAAALAQDERNRVVFVTRRGDRELPGVERIVYPAPRPVHARTHNYLQQFEEAVLHGQAVARVCLRLVQGGFAPDLVVAHPGWGESLFIRDIFPNTPVLSYGEFYYRAFGADVNFGSTTRLDMDAIFKLRVRCAHFLLALEAATHIWCPTEWQKSLHPGQFHNRISVIHEGVDTDLVKPDRDAAFVLPDGRVLTRKDEVVTFLSRTLEPYRGFDAFMRALPRLCELRPTAQIVIAGEDRTAYGSPPPGGKSWLATMLGEVPIDPSRVHVLGPLPHEDYVKALQVSKVHVYLTVPFVLSWSVLEAMAAGCLVVGSRTAPVQEAITAGENGLLVDFFSTAELAETVAVALQADAGLDHLRKAARETVLDRYSLAKCLPLQRALLDMLTRTAKSAV